MPLVAAGTTAIYTFTGNQNVTVSPDPSESAMVQVLRGGTTLFSGSIKTPQTIGPFVASDVLTVTAQRGAVDYTIADAPSSVAGDGTLIAAAGNLDSLIVGAITRDSNGAATSAGVVWPDGATGTYTATTVSVAFPGAVDAYTVTYSLGVISKTFTQAAVTRNAEGAVTVRPAITVV